MQNPLRIALVSAFPPGRQSLNEYGLHLARGLAESASVSEVIVIADRLEDGQQELDLGPKVRVCRVWDFNSIASPAKIVAALRREKVDGAIYNVQTASFGDKEAPAALGLMTPMLSRLAGVPSGVIAHNIIAGIDLENTVLKGQRIRQALVRAGGAIVTRAMASANYTTVTLKSYVEIMKDRCPAADVSLVPHGTFDTQQRDMVPFEDRPSRIVTMGKFGTYKRLETLLAAFDTVRQDTRFADMQLVIGGSDHPNTPGYMASVAESRKNDSGVIFHGYVAEEDVPEFFGNSRLSVFDYESTTGSSGVLHQTASYGAVPVFPRIGDFVDVCEDEGLQGAHYKARDAESMATAMAAVLSEPAHASEVAKSNRDAALGMPFSHVVDYHVSRLSAIRATKPRSVGAAIIKPAV